MIVGMEGVLRSHEGVKIEGEKYRKASAKNPSILGQQLSAFVSLWHIYKC